MSDLLIFRLWSSIFFCNKSDLIFLLWSPIYFCSKSDLVIFQLWSTMFCVEWHLDIFTLHIYPLHFKKYILFAYFIIKLVFDFVCCCCYYIVHTLLYYMQKLLILAACPKDLFMCCVSPTCSINTPSESTYVLIKSCMFLLISSEIFISLIALTPDSIIKFNMFNYLLFALSAGSSL